MKRNQLLDNLRKDISKEDRVLTSIMYNKIISKKEGMNAKREFVNFTSNTKVLAAEVYYNEKSFFLKLDHSPEDYEKFLEKLDFDYDSGYGVQNLYGTIWFQDRRWATREEYDGSEWWQYHRLPQIPNYLK